MAYDEMLAQRVRGALGRRGDLDEKKTFGGLAFLVGGHMACGVVGGELMVRVGRRRTRKPSRSPACGGGT